MDGSAEGAAPSSKEILVCFARRGAFGAGSDIFVLII
jgi:hypothetical protein